MLLFSVKNGKHRW